MSSNSLIFQFPVVFEISGNLILFGEVFQQDLVSPHLTFDVVGTDISASRFERVFLVGDSNSGTNLFYARADTNGGDQTDEKNYVSNLSHFIAQALMQNGKLKFNSNFSTQKVPMGPSIRDQDPSQNYYTGTLTDSSGNYYNEVITRILSTHLLGNPFIQAFIKNEGDLYNQLSSNAKVEVLADQLNETLGGDVSGNITASANPLGNLNVSTLVSQNMSNGKSNNVLQGFYEQMFVDTSNNATRRIKFQQMQDSSSVLVDGQTYVNGMPFLPGDKIDFFFRNKINLAVEAVAGSGNQQQGGNFLPSVSLSDIFKGGNLLTDLSNVPAPGRYGWMGFSYDLSQNGLYGPGELTQQTTDVSGNSNIFDAHIWKLRITLV